MWECNTISRRGMDNRNHTGIRYRKYAGTCLSNKQPARQAGDSQAEGKVRGKLLQTIIEKVGSGRVCSWTTWMHGYADTWPTSQSYPVQGPRLPGHRCTVAPVGGYVQYGRSERLVQRAHRGPPTARPGTSAQYWPMKSLIRYGNCVVWGINCHFGAASPACKSVEHCVVRSCQELWDLSRNSFSPFPLPGPSHLPASAPEPEPAPSCIVCRCPSSFGLSTRPIAARAR